MTRHVVTENARTLKAHVGDEVVVQLAERAMAGYEWRIVDPLPTGVEVVGTEQPVPSVEGIGADVTRALVFRVKEPGRHHVRLVHQRPWETAEQAISSFDLEVLAD